MERNQPPASPRNAEPGSLPRCRHVSRTGKHCRYLAISWGNQFCKTHAKPPDPTDPLLCSQLADLMEEDVPSFQSAKPLANILYIIFFALAEGRISERRAAVMCGIIHTVLRTHRAVAAEQKAAKAAAAERLAAEPWRRLPECLWPDEFKSKPDTTSTTQTSVATSHEEQKQKDNLPSPQNQTSEASVPISSRSAALQKPASKIARNGTPEENEPVANCTALLAKLPQDDRKPDSPPTPSATAFAAPVPAPKPAPASPNPPMNYVHDSAVHFPMAPSPSHSKRTSRPRCLRPPHAAWQCPPPIPFRWLLPPQSYLARRLMPRGTKGSHVECGGPEPTNGRRSYGGSTTPNRAISLGMAENRISALTKS